MIHHEGQHRLGEQRDADENEDQRRLRKDRDHDRPARPDAAIGAAGVETRQRDHEGSEGQDQPAAEDVAHVRQRQRVVGENRDQDRNGQRRGEGHDRGRPIEPGGRFRRDDLFVEELPEVTIGLKNSRTLAALDPLLELQDHALEQRREHQGGQNLGDLQNDVANDHRRPPRKGSSASRTSSQSRNRHNRIPTASSVCQVGSTGVISPEGGYKANSIASQEVDRPPGGCQEAHS